MGLRTRVFKLDLLRLRAKEDEKRVKNLRGG